jgi:poly-beta-1,6-N-acetyl-D-glucosamine synthase
MVKAINQYKYALVSPAKNEEKFLANTIKSIVAQTIRPVKWIIVSDDSTDNTDEIAENASLRYEFIDFIKLSNGGRRSFSSKADAFKAGYTKIKMLPFYFLGNLDADITIPIFYYEEIISRIIEDSKIGVASGYCLDKTKIGFRKTISSHNHAVGAVHLWRREAYDMIGGYNRVTAGGMDSISLFTARMYGWKTIAYQDLPVYHHKPIGSGTAKSRAKIAWMSGLTEYYIGTLPLFAIVKGIRRWRAHPIFLSGVLRIVAYFALLTRGKKRDVRLDVYKFVKVEQSRRLIDFVLFRSKKN